MTQTRGGFYGTNSILLYVMQHKINYLMFDTSQWKIIDAWHVYTKKMWCDYFCCMKLTAKFVIWSLDYIELRTMRFYSPKIFFCDLTKAKSSTLWAFLLYYPINCDYWPMKSTISNIRLYFAKHFLAKLYKNLCLITIK